MAQLDYIALRSALLALELGFAEHAAYPQLLTVRDGVIQRFEIAMDLSWKLLQRTLKVRFEVTEVELLTKKDIFRQAAKFALIDSHVLSFEAWANLQLAFSESNIPLSCRSGGKGNSERRVLKDYDRLSPNEGGLTE